MTILVVILSITLGIFLILGIIFLVKVIKIAGNVQHITQKAEQIADKAEAVTEVFSQAAGPMAFSRVVANIVDAVSGKNKGK